MTRNLKEIIKVEHIVDSFTCDVCKTEVHSDDIFQFQERLSINIHAGFGSILGDGNVIECDLCQHCVEKLLGSYLRVIGNYIWD